MRIGWRTELPQLVVIGLMFLASALLWSRVPERVPVHWDIYGQVDRYGGKFEGLFFLPLLAVGVYLLMRFLPIVDPRRGSYEQFANVYSSIRFAVVLVLAAVYGVTLAATLSVDVDIALVIPLIVGAVLVFLGNLMGKVRTNWFVGIKTPWTLSSELSWNKTHRFGGKVIMLQGLAVALSGFLGSGAWIPVTLTVVIGGAVLMFVYSYFVWRSDPDRTDTSKPSRRIR